MNSQLAFLSLVAVIGSVAAGAHAQSSQSTGNSGPGGESFTVRTVIDHREHDMTAGSFQAPQAWTARSDVLWNYANDKNPANVVFAVTNPANEEAAFMLPAAEFVAVPGVVRQGRAGYGRIWGNPVPPIPALSAVVQQARGSAAGFRIVAGREVPDLAALRGMNPADNPHGVAVRVSYELKGKPVEEEFYAAYLRRDICSNSPAGRACETDWGLYSPYSFRAQAGTLDRRMPVFQAIIASTRVNPQWRQRVAAVQSQLRAQVVAEERNHHDRSEAARTRVEHIKANSAASLAASDRRTMAIRGGGGGSAPEGRSSADQADDVIRGVTTLDDPNGGTTQRDSNSQYHWTDGNGSYRDSNDGTYDPNNSENGSWKLMNESR